jgi:hypothetical protein
LRRTVRSGPSRWRPACTWPAATPNFLCQEHVTLGETLLKRPFVVENGHVALPGGPGLASSSTTRKWKRNVSTGAELPRFAHADGSFAEW